MNGKLVEMITTAETKINKSQMLVIGNETEWYNNLQQYTQVCKLKNCDISWNNSIKIKMKVLNYSLAHTQLKLSTKS